MQAVSHNLSRRGKRGTYYLRRRVPTHLLDAYPPGKKEISRSLRTSDRAVAEQRFHAQMVKVDAEFERRRAKLSQHWLSSAQPTQHVTYLSDEQVKDLANTYVQLVLQSDEEARRRGLDEEAFEELGSRIAQQRAELGKLLARGDTAPLVPAMHGFFQLCNITAQLPPDDERRAAYQ